MDETSQSDCLHAKPSHPGITCYSGGSVVEVWLHWSDSQEGLQAKAEGLAVLPVLLFYNSINSEILNMSANSKLPTQNGNDFREVVPTSKISATLD
jgi:hypothetical protein